MTFEEEEALARGVLLAVLAGNPEMSGASATLYVGYGDRLQRRIASGLGFSLVDTPLRRATRAILQREMEAIGWKFDPGGYDIWDRRLAFVQRSDVSAHELVAAARRFGV
jgi:hypothetical protein